MERKTILTHLEGSLPIPYPSLPALPPIPPALTRTFIARIRTPTCDVGGSTTKQSSPHRAHTRTPTCAGTRRFNAYARIRTPTCAGTRRFNSAPTSRRGSYVDYSKAGAPQVPSRMSSGGSRQAAGVIGHLRVGLLLLVRVSASKALNEGACGSISFALCSWSFCQRTILHHIYIYIIPVYIYIFFALCPWSLRSLPAHHTSGGTAARQAGLAACGHVVMTPPPPT